MMETTKVQLYSGKFITDTVTVVLPGKNIVPLITSETIGKRNVILFDAGKVQLTTADAAPASFESSMSAGHIGTVGAEGETQFRIHIKRKKRCISI